MNQNNAILSVKNIKVYFDVNNQFRFPWQKINKIKAVDDVSFNINEGETLGIVGETGCGKFSRNRTRGRRGRARGGSHGGVLHLAVQSRGPGHPVDDPERSAGQVDECRSTYGNVAGSFSGPVPLVV